MAREEVAAIPIAGDSEAIVESGKQAADPSGIGDWGGMGATARGAVDWQGAGRIGCPETSEQLSALEKVGIECCSGVQFQIEPAALPGKIENEASGQLGWEG